MVPDPWNRSKGRPKQSDVTVPAESGGGVDANYPVTTKGLPEITTDPPTIEARLPPEFRTGLEALRGFNGLPADAVYPVTDSNQVFVCLGVWNLPIINDSYVDEASDTAVYARYSRRFGQDDDTEQQYGFTTYPETKIKNGDLANVRLGQGHTQDLAKALDVDTNAISYWSWNWNDVEITDPEDMVRLVPMIRARFTEA